MRVLTLGLACMMAVASSASPAEPAAPIEVMVLGTYHFSGGADVANVAAVDVRTPQRQKELENVAAAVAAFRPTAVVVERETAAPDYIDPNYAAFKPSVLKEKTSEREQLGYRIARLAKVARVYGIDEQPSAGEPDYFPFGKLQAAAEKNGAGAKLNALIADAQTLVSRESEKFRTMTMAQALLETNTGPLSDDSFYFGLSAFDRGEDQPGAELQAFWFMRNAKIFSKIMQVAKPGDRILVVYGAGHKAWLEQFARKTPGFSSVDPAPFLRRSAQ